MILNSDQLTDNAILDCDVCIIGSGPAGVSVALELLNTSKKIIMITGGQAIETAFNQDLNRGIIAPGTYHEPLEENRRRQFGGTSSAWGGRCIPFDPIDFEKRDWIPHSGWPITYKELLPYYKLASELCLSGDNADYNATSVFPGTQKEIINGLDDENIVSWPLEKWSPPINFGKHYKKVLEDSPNIRVLMNANATKINSLKEKEKIDSITVVCEGKIITVNAGTFILAAGGIENPRLLLASASELHPNGIGNGNDNVGRYYMSHLMGLYAELDPFNRNKMVFDFERENGVYARRRWWLNESFQRKEHIGNIIMFLHQPGGVNGHRDAMFSSVYVAKSLISIIRQKSLSRGLNKYRQLKPSLKEHSKNILKNGFSLVPQMLSLATKRFSKRRLPFVLPSLKSKYFGLYYQAEHMPVPESRVTISKENTDALGVPRAVVNIAFSEPDIQTVIKAHQAFISRYKAISAGNVIYDEQELIKYLENRVKVFNSSAHHLGTTRMAGNPAEGVVDADCKVFGIDNLYVAGGSVFPTGGHANPTLTIVALAARLADHLKKV